MIIGAFIVEDTISDVENFISGCDGAAAEFLNNESQIATTSLRDLYADYIIAPSIDQAAVRFSLVHAHFSAVEHTANLQHRSYTPSMLPD